jgi:hypothetical protein
MHPAFFYVRPAGRTYLEVEVLYVPDRENCYPHSTGASGMGGI